MGAAYFYQLKDSPLETTLPMLIGKARDAGWRVLVRAADPNLRARLDETLWQGPDTGFLPHGVSGGPHDAAQPVLIGDGAADGFECVICVAGAEITIAEVGAAQRTCILFDGWDDAALNHARGQWKTLTDGGAAAQYWAQEDGRWAMKAQKG